jgi:hypothetical protein
LLNQPLAALIGPGFDKPVWHCALRAAPGDRELSDEEWAQVAGLVMDRTGLAPAGDEVGVRWVAVRHAADHVHLVATLGAAGRDAAPDLERFLPGARGLPGGRGVVGADRDCSGGSHRGAASDKGRDGAGGPARAGGGAPDPAAPRGVRGRGRSGHESKDGGTIWYGGGKLAADLTLPKLRHRWNASGDSTAPPGAGLPPAGARAALRVMAVRASPRPRPLTLRSRCGRRGVAGR